MFGKLGQLVGKATGAVTGAMDRVVHEDELTAVVAGTVLIAAADGRIDDLEKETAFKSMATHEALQSFDQRKVRKLFDEDARLINADRKLAEEVLYDKVSAVTDKIARIKLLGIINEIANADGEFSDAEKKVVNKIRDVTGRG